MTSMFLRLDLSLSFMNARQEKLCLTPLHCFGRVWMCFSLSSCRTFALHTCCLVCDRVQVKSIRSQLSKQSVEPDQVSLFPPDRGLFALYWALSVARKPKASGAINTGPFMPHYGTQRCLSDPDQSLKFFIDLDQASGAVWDPARLHTGLLALDLQHEYD